MIIGVEMRVGRKGEGDRGEKQLGAREGGTYNSDVPEGGVSTDEVRQEGMGGGSKHFLIFPDVITVWSITSQILKEGIIM